MEDTLSPGSQPAAPQETPAAQTPQPRIEQTQTIQADNGTFNAGSSAQDSQTASRTQTPQEQSDANPVAQETASLQNNQPPADGQTQPSEQTDPSTQPITDWANSGVNTEGLNFEPEVWDSFGRQAVELGLTPKQAESLARWQLDMIGERQAVIKEKNFNEIKSEWGTNAGAFQSRCNNLVSRIDRALGKGSRFSQALDATGASANADFVRGLLVIANALGEDRGSTPGQDFIKPVTEDALSGLQAAFAQARSRR